MTSRPPYHRKAAVPIITPENTKPVSTPIWAPNISPKNNPENKPLASPKPKPITKAFRVDNQMPWLEIVFVSTIWLLNPPNSSVTKLGTRGIFLSGNPYIILSENLYTFMLGPNPVDSCFLCKELSRLLGLVWFWLVSGAASSRLG
jgi:hypothetical protein